MRRTCSEPNCERPARGRGLCSRHYQRYKYRGVLTEVAPNVASECRVCGAALPVGHDYRKVFCSDGCGDEWRKRLRREARDAARAKQGCRQCGGTLAGRRADAVFCSLGCASTFRNGQSAQRRRENRKPCVNCGNAIPLHAHRFCSNACALAFRRPQSYGLSPVELATLLSQHSVCAICRTADWGRKGPQVDHDHATGRVRGVLCISCNNGLGRFKDDTARLLAAVEYLTR